MSNLKAEKSKAAGTDTENEAKKTREVTVITGIKIQVGKHLSDEEARGLYLIYHNS